MLGKELQIFTAMYIVKYLSIYQIKFLKFAYNSAVLRFGNVAIWLNGSACTTRVCEAECSHWPFEMPMGKLNFSADQGGFLVLFAQIKQLILCFSSSSTKA